MHIILSLIDVNSGTPPTLPAKLYLLVLFLMPFSVLEKYINQGVKGLDISYPKDFFFSYAILMVLITAIGSHFDAQLGGHLFN